MKILFPICSLFLCLFLSACIAPKYPSPAPYTPPKANAKFRTPKALKSRDVKIFHHERLIPGLEHYEHAGFLTFKKKAPGLTLAKAFDSLRKQAVKYGAEYLLIHKIKSSESYLNIKSERSIGKIPQTRLYIVAIMLRKIR